MTEEDVEKIEEANIQEFRIRSVLTCETRTGCAARCYGRDLARGTPVNMGEAVGVIAAQSIGEPGTQLTMRTFHIGGTAQVLDASFVESNIEGVVKMRNRNWFVTPVGQDHRAMGRNMCRWLSMDEQGNERAVHDNGTGARLLVDEGDKVKRGSVWLNGIPYTRPVMTEVDGIIEFEDRRRRRLGVGERR